MTAQAQTLTRAQFLDRVAAARHGESIRYHIGHLLVDRLEGFGINAMLVKNTAHAAFEATEQGHVHLVQRRLGDGVFEYLAVKRDPPVPIVWQGCYDPDNGKYVKPKAKGLDRVLARKQGRRKVGADTDPGSSDRPIFQDAA